MGRNILAVLVGYITMALIVGLLLGGSYIAMGEDRAFLPNIFEISTLWLVAMFSAGIVAAVLGGTVCASISKHSKGAVLSLMGIVLVLGLVMAFSNMSQPAADIPEVRVSGTSMQDARTKAEEPVWVSFMHPVIGCIGVMLGAMLVCPDRRKKSSDSQAPVADE